MGHKIIRSLQTRSVKILLKVLIKIFLLVKRFFKAHMLCNVSHLNHQLRLSKICIFKGLAGKVIAIKISNFHLKIWSKLNSSTNFGVLDNIYMLYISTSVWVLHTQKTSCNIFFYIGGIRWLLLHLQFHIQQFTFLNYSPVGQTLFQPYYFIKLA